MRLGKERSAPRLNKNQTIQQILQSLSSPALVSRVQSAARNAALAQLKAEGIDLTPEQWGELAATLLSQRRDAGDVLAGAASVVIGLAISDRRCKHDVVRVGELPSGLGLYEYSYVGFSTRWRGVIAQEVATVRPDAVAADPSGYLLVNYSRLGILPQAA